MDGENKPTATGGDNSKPAGDSQENLTPGEEKALRKANKEAEKFRLERNQLKATLDDVNAKLSGMETMLKAVDEDRKKAEKAAFDATRKAVALKHGLPPELADRLVGKDEAELEADALKIAGVLPKQAPGANGSGSSASPANPAGTPATLTLEEIKNMTPQEIVKRRTEVQAVLAGKP